MSQTKFYYTSWGYEQTNIEFFQVVNETPKSITLRRVASKRQNNQVVPMQDVFIIDFLLRGSDPESTKYKRDTKRGYSQKTCRKNNSNILRIDKVRYAFPYKGKVIASDSEH